MKRLYYISKSISAASLLLFSLSANTIFAKTFSDIAETDEYFLATDYLSEKNIINGYEDGSFKAENTINRAELLKIVLESAKIEISEAQTNCFTDVPYTKWYSKYICTAKELGFISGYSDNTFRPEKNIKKVEALKIIGEIYQWDMESADKETVFKDTEETAWYSPYLKFAKMKNLLKEVGEIYEPNKEIKRGEIVEIIYRYIAMTEFQEKIYTKNLDFKVRSNLKTVTPPKSLIKISGLLSDAQTGYALTEAEITAYDQNENFQKTVNTDDEGYFTIEGIDRDGKIIFSKENYFPIEIKTKILTKKNLHFSLSHTFTKIEPQELRIVLTWGNKDVDFDAHLLQPNEEEIFFMQRLDTDLNTILDIDSTSKNGTETITIKKFQKGDYEFFVHKYSGTDSFNKADAHVFIYDKNGLAAIFTPAKSEETDLIWKVFSLNSKGEIIEQSLTGSCDLIEKYSTVCPGIER
ncbi:S-layer homology domain-containing protein [Candidatus Peregrinibacteria bacterium]|nr:S-layer homology domain-containing protein [Candidatus Peregrinibacteria bacterium]